MIACRNHPDAVEGIRHCSRCGGPFCGDCLVTINNRLYCATCKNEQLLDLRSGMDRTTLPFAGIGKRFAAVLLDGLIVNIPAYLIFILIPMLMSMRSKEPPILMMVLWIPYIFVQPVYEALMFQHRNGQTLGKKIMGIRVSRVDGSAMSPGQAWGRAFLKLVFGCLSIIDYIPALFTPEKTTLHDMAASTRVVDVY